MAPKPTKAERGIWKNKRAMSDPDVKVADFSYQNPKLAQLIVDAWNDPGPGGLAARLTDHNHQNIVKGLLDARDVSLIHPVVLTEDEYNAGWQMDNDDEVVFVLPNSTRADLGASPAKLLETAKMLMACVPNGI
jgi:hypothetical protein